MTMRRYINARDKFGNDCAGSHTADEFIVDINGIAIDMMYSHAKIRENINLQETDGLQDWGSKKSTQR